MAEASRQPGVVAVPAPAARPVIPYPGVMSKARGSYAKGVAKRQEILAVALDVIAERGCHKATIREIAERVGLSQAGLLHYFSSREEMYVEVLRARDQRDNDEFWTPQAGIGTLLAIIGHNAAVPGLVRLYVEYSAEASIPGHPAHAFFAERYDWVAGKLAHGLRNERRAGVLGPGIEVHTAVELLLAAADGVQAHWLVDPSVDMVGRVQAVWDLIRRTSHL